MIRLSWMLVALGACGGSARQAPASKVVAPEATAEDTSSGDASSTPDEQADTSEPEELPAPPPPVAVEPRAKGGAPELDLGETSFVHGSHVRALAVCDASRAVSLDSDPRAHVWQLANGKLAFELGGLQSEILREIACRGALIVTAIGNTTTLYRNDRELVHATIREPLAATFDGDKAIVAAGDGHIYELDDRGARIVWTAKLATTGSHHVVRRDRFVSARGRTLEWATPKATTKVELPADAAALADTDDGVIVALASGDIHVLASPALGKPRAHVAVAADDEIRSVAADRGWFAIGTRQGQLLQVKPDGQALPPIRVVADQMYGAVGAIAALDDAWLIGGDDQLIRRFPRGSTKDADAPSRPYPSAFGFDRELFVFAASMTELHVANRTGKLVRTLAVDDRVHDAGVGRDFVWAVANERLRRWNRKTWREAKAIADVYNAVPIDDHTVVAMQLSNLSTLDLTTGKRTPIDLELDMLEVHVAARGTLLAVWDDVHTERPIQVFDRATNRVLASVAPIGDSPTTIEVAISDDAQYIAIAEDERIRIWSRKDGSVRELGANRATISSIAFAHDGRLATGDWLGMIRVWKLDESAPIVEFANHRGWVHRLVWSGDKLASLGADRRVQLVTPR